MAGHDAQPQREENERLTREVERLEAELSRMRQVHDDLWAHEVYLKARSKMFGGLLALTAVLGALGLGTLNACGTAVSTNTSRPRLASICGASSTPCSGRNWTAR